MRKPKFKRAFCPFVYRGNVRKSILNFKSNGAKYLAKPFAKFMYEKICQSNINFDLIVPVPSHKSTIKKRGYNPAVLLANELSVLLNVPVKEVLIKNVKTKPQKSLNFNERQENLIDSMTITNKDEIKDKVILLIDDIMTTGATINYCCTLLSSAKEIYVSTIARNEIKN